MIRHVHNRTVRGDGRQMSSCQGEGTGGAAGGYGTSSGGDGSILASVSSDAGARVKTLQTTEFVRLKMEDFMLGESPLDKKTWNINIIHDTLHIPFPHTGPAIFCAYFAFTAHPPLDGGWPSDTCAPIPEAHASWGQHRGPSLKPRRFPFSSDFGKGLQQPSVNEGEGLSSPGTPRPHGSSGLRMQQPTPMVICPLRSPPAGGGT